MTWHEWNARTTETAPMHLAVEPYASSKDFCAIFAKEMGSLYGLALFLCADHDRATRTFLAALSDCLKSETVFKEQARSWSRRAIFKHALQAMNPASPSALTETPRREIAEQVGPQVRPLIGLSAFDRFVFAMLILERYSTSECAALLGTDRKDIEAARQRALRVLARDRGEAAPAPGRFGLAAA
jgi:hypothetical protein